MSSYRRDGSAQVPLPARLRKVVMVAGAGKQMTGEVAVHEGAHPGPGSITESPESRPILEGNKKPRSFERSDDLRRAVFLSPTAEIWV
jgi:hypothetical protein